MNRSPYKPFNIPFDEGDPNLGDLYKKFFNIIFIKTDIDLTLDKFNDIITKFTSRQYNHPIVVKASLNHEGTNFHSFTMTILNNTHMIISGANGASKGLCSVAQDNKITVVKFQEYLQVIQDIKMATRTRSPHSELINLYDSLYNEIFFKNFIIRNVYDETGITMYQYILIIIGIYNYIVDTYKSKNKLIINHYIEYLSGLQYVTKYFQSASSSSSKINKYILTLRDIIIEIPEMIETLTQYKTRIRRKNKKIKKRNNDSDSDSGSDSDSDSDSDTDSDDYNIEDYVDLILDYLLTNYNDENQFNNVHMYTIIKNVIYNILNEDGIPEYFLIEQMDKKYSHSTEEYHKFKLQQLNLLTNITNINVCLLGITGKNIRDYVSLCILNNHDEPRSDIFDMYQNIGNLFIKENHIHKLKSKEEYDEDDDEEDKNDIPSEGMTLMSAPIVLIYILNTYCKPTIAGGYMEFIESYINEYLTQNIKISYIKFNVYNFLKKSLFLRNEPDLSSHSLSLSRSSNTLRIPDIIQSPLHKKITESSPKTRKRKHNVPNQTNQTITRISLDRSCKNKNTKNYKPTTTTTTTTTTKSKSKKR
jgi:hypothetical protein